MRNWLAVVWAAAISGAGLWCIGAPAVYAAHNAPGVGSVPPDFTAKNAVTGEEIRLSAQQGKLVILTFWATWCGPCRRELPILEKTQRFLGKDRLTVLAVSFRESPQAFRALRKVATDWPITLIEDFDGKIAAEYSITAIPHLFLIGRDGTILSTHTGYGESSLDELVADINRAFRLESAVPESSGSPPEQ